MAVLSSDVGTQRLSSLSSAVETKAAANSMLSCSQSSARCVLTFMVMTPVGQVAIAGDGHELDITRPPQYDMIGPEEVDYIKASVLVQ
jgi:hypothetical protein